MLQYALLDELEFVFAPTNPSLEIFFILSRGGLDPESASPQYSRISVRGGVRDLMPGRVHHVLRVLIALRYSICFLARSRFSCTCGLPAVRGENVEPTVPFLKVNRFLSSSSVPNPAEPHNVGRQNQW